MPPKPKDLKTTAAQAAEQERAHDWLGASESYKNGLSLIGEHDFSALGEEYERIGYAAYRAAMQSKNQEQFKERMQQATKAYEKAHGFYDQMEGKQEAKMFRCKAFSKYLGYWLSPSPAEKRRLLDECLDLEDRALVAFLGSGNPLEYVRTFNLLALAIIHRSVLEWNRQTLKATIERGTEWAEKTIELCSKSVDSYETGRAFLGLGLVRVCDFFGYFFTEDPQDQEQLRLKVIEHFREAVEFSQKANDAHSLSLSYYWMGLYSGAQESLVQKALEYGEEAQDNYLQGFALDLLAYIMFWKCFATEDPDQTKDLAKEAMRYYDRAQCHFNILSYQSPRWGALPAPAGYAEYYLGWSELEPDQQKKIELLSMSEKTGKEALKIAEDSDIPLIISSVLHVVSKTIAAQAGLEQNSDVKRSLLERAIKLRERAIEITEQLTPYDYWDRGVELFGLAKINSQLSSLEKDFDNKKNLLEEAIAQAEKSLKLVGKIMPYFEAMGRTELYSSVYRMQISHSAHLTMLYELTKNTDYLEKAIITIRKAIESAEKIEIVNQVAESYWKIAKIQDTIGEHIKAAENFLQASESYAKASNKIPALKAFYKDYAAYMEAWSQIENAKQHHLRQEYGLAKEYYERAAKIHKSLKQWSYLTPNYLAWFTLENAEDLSRKEKNEQAIQNFQKATKLFDESNAAIKDAVEKIENPEEKQLAENLIKATEIRHEYCVARIILEEAKSLDKKDNHLLSSEKFAEASKIFNKIAHTIENEPERKDLKLIATLAEAWQKMTQAETEISPTLYAEASQLFQQAKDISPDEKTKMQTMGHSHFCKALEAGTKFVDTKDMTTWNTAIQELDAAGNYYTKAGFQSASEFTKATGLLFNAYIYIDKAKKETDPEKKTKLYIITEKILEASADHFEKAEHPEKRIQARNLMKEIEKEKEFALSLAEVLHTPLIVSTTSFPVPAATIESAVGSERFGQADIQTNLKASEDVEIGEQFEVLLDLVNIGNSHGLLVRLDHLAPPGTKLTSLTPQYDVENSSANLRGKKIDPLRLESIKINLEATKTGPISLEPHVVYVDDKGHFRTSKPEPVNVSVHSKVTFEFHTKEAEKLFNHLVNSFVEDYMKRRLSLEKSGWRTLNEIVTHGQIPKSSVYGTGGRRGRDIAELERRGIVECRTFMGERGRGGNILKVRIPYDKETIKRYVDERVMRK